jgi:hypothetical protein
VAEAFASRTILQLGTGIGDRDANRRAASSAERARALESTA